MTPESGMSDKKPSGGQIGNTNATKNKPFREALDRAIKQDDGKRLRKAAERLLTMAASSKKGDTRAIKELADRLDGKSVQPLSGFDGGDIKVTLLKGDENA
jgi:hypothetical protein